MIEGLFSAVNWTILNGSAPIDQIQNLSSASFIVRDWLNSDTITACMIIITSCQVYLVAENIHQKWKNHWRRP